MEAKLRVALIGCGRMGQEYAKFYSVLDNTEIVAIAEYNDERRKAVGERFGVRALYRDTEEMYGQMEGVPDLAVTVLPGKFIKDAVIASAQAGVRGVSTEKPIGAKLSDVDADDRYLHGAWCRLPWRQFAERPLRRARGRWLAPAG